jgi:hypothetical protein
VETHDDVSPSLTNRREGRQGATRRRSWSGYGFGLRLSGDLVLPSLATDADEAPARRVRTRIVARAELDRAWPVRRAARLVEHRLLDGRVGMSVDRSSAGSFRIWAPRHGLYVVAPDGSSVAGAPPSGPAWRWERLVLAQALPLAAALQGLELLHASAVALDGRAYAITGPSGTGKTSTAFHALALGATLVTDDVLALEVRDGVPTAFPGSTVARVDPEQMRAIPIEQRRRLGEVVARGEKYHLALAGARRSLPLGAVYHLVRPVATVQRISITADDPPDPLPILGNAFLAYLRDPVRLSLQLSVCAAIIERVPLRRVEVPAGCRADEVARAVLEDSALA